MQQEPIGTLNNHKDIYYSVSFYLCSTQKPSY